MELKDLDCPFCQGLGDWKVRGIEFVEKEVYIQTECPNCHRELIVSVPIIFSQMRMFVTPKSNRVRMDTPAIRPTEPEATKAEDTAEKSES